MRWLQKSSQEPAELIGLSPLKAEDTLSISNRSINLIEQKQDINYETNQSSRKSRKGKNSWMDVSIINVMCDENDRVCLSSFLFSNFNILMFI